MNNTSYLISHFSFLIFLTVIPLQAAEDIDPREVNNLIDRAVMFLKGKQNRDGSWGTNDGQIVGYTSLNALALLSSGTTPQDPAIQKALAYLRKYPPEKIAGGSRTYCVSLQTMVYCLAEPERDKLLIRKNVDWLQQIQVKDGTNKGGWGYGDEGRGTGYADVSCSQFAVLALYEAERVGVTCEASVWTDSKAYWERTQSGGQWGYQGPTGISGSRTCAGIASLLIASGMSEQGGAAVNGENIHCCLDAAAASATIIQQGLNWLGREFSPASNPRGHGSYYFYYMYGVERVGRTTGHRFFGQHDWYREGTKELMRRTGVGGNSWEAGGEDALLATPFALLFLSKGRRPLLLSKIQYEIDDNSWNIHPQDINQLTQFVEKQWKMDLTWQTVHWEHATIEDLLQSPVLYLCGNKNPLPRDRNRADKIVEKLRQYLDQGGFIFAEAYGDDESFDDGFRSLMRKVLPEEEYELRLLDKDHPVWDAEIVVSPSQIRPIEGIDFGCQTSVIYCPPAPKETRIVSQGPAEQAQYRPVAQRRPMPVSQYRPSLSCLWEIARLVDRGDPYAKSVQDQIDAGLAIGCNILAYATDRELKTKLEKYESVKIEPKVKQTVDRGFISIGLLQHGGGSNCAPRAIPRLMEAAVARYGMPVSVQVEKISLTQPNLSDYPILFMHGRNAFRLTTTEREALRKYVDRGGFLFVNSICASAAFTKSFEEEMKLVFPDEPLVLIPTDDPLYSEEYGGKNIEKVKLRSSQRTPGRKIEASVLELPPELSGIRREGRLGVIFSPYDISCALEKLNSMECKGYSQESALDIGINALLYAMEHI
ncbi:MAG: DUF4159 domain-containing protein [Planctomycetaceae bacterium]|nr:DUF4159 domain-containing protein [Planctomycetaceae bacterium]